MQKYLRLPMTATVHKVLLHSRQIIASAVLKIYKSDRLFHARKSSRVNNLRNVFNRVLDTSDTLISSL